MHLGKIVTKIEIAKSFPKLSWVTRSILAENEEIHICRMEIKSTYVCIFCVSTFIQYLLNNAYVFTFP